jgi:hypothetical protein
VRARFVYTGVVNQRTKGHGAHNSLWSLTLLELCHSHAFQRLEMQISQSILDEPVIDSTLSGQDYGRMQPELTMDRYLPPRIWAVSVERCRWHGSRERRLELDLKTLAGWSAIPR